MYCSIFAKSFSRHDRQRFTCYALLVSLLIALTIFNPAFYQFTSTKEAQNIVAETGHENKTEASWNQEPLCRILTGGADYCEIEGDVRVDSNSSTVFVIASNYSAANSWSIEPYPRKRSPFVKKWTVRVNTTPIPKCTQNHSHPALLFSTGGFAGNFFHDFADILFPLFTTSFPFQTNLHLLATNYQSWWISKYRLLLHQLTRHPILDIDHQSHHIHCHNKLTAGLIKSHQHLAVDPTSGLTTSQFRHLLRKTYSLHRNKAVVATKPRLLIVSRKRTRVITNEAEISGVATKLGYEVVSAECNHRSNLTEVAQVVNSCDVMMGIHGAGLTNMVFLPEKAVLIQVVPWGRIGRIARVSFGDPCAGMTIRYLEYESELEESSLLQRYSMDHPVIKDPLSIHKQGFSKLVKVYFSQNFTIDVARFRSTLVKALQLLRH